MAQDGHRHSDLLQLLAATVPPQVWLIELRWQTGQLELDGATLDTSALRAWLDRLALQPLLEGLQLTTIKVEKSNLGASKGALADSWNFTLRSQTPAVDGTANHPAAVLTKP
ncbi:PilN domain-containing protein [Roseateles sp. GG27B]